jgi:peptidoglycan hydrolase-like protein with peptidoglycan-binding domain
MPLLSQMFSGDAKLEACAVHDSAHIAQGARGDHVSKIQSALNLVDRATLQIDGIYGAFTAAAVLRYKQVRNIVNRSYQQQADNVVGRMTIDRLDKDVLAAEQNPDSRLIRCVFPPVTEASTRRSFAVGAAPAEITGFTLLGEARASLPLAKSWVAATITKLDQVNSKLGPRIFFPEDIAFFSSIETHFKVNISSVSESVARDRIIKIKRMYEKIQRILTVIATDRLEHIPPASNRGDSQRSADERVWRP